MTTILTQLPIERLGWVLIHSLWEFLAIALVVRLFAQVSQVAAAPGHGTPPDCAAWRQ